MRTCSPMPSTRRCRVPAPSSLQIRSTNSRRPTAKHSVDTGCLGCSLALNASSTHAAYTHVADKGVVIGLWHPRFPLDALLHARKGPSKPSHGAHSERLSSFPAQLQRSDLDHRQVS